MRVEDTRGSLFSSAPDKPYTVITVETVKKVYELYAPDKETAEKHVRDGEYESCREDKVYNIDIAEIKEDI